MKAVEASAKTREEAIQNALKELGVEMYEVDKIEVIDEGSKGLFGLGARPVRVRLVVESLHDEPQRDTARESEGRNRRGGNRSRGGGRDRERSERPERSESRDRTEPRERAEAGERAEGEATQERNGRGEGRNGRGSRAEREGGERPPRENNRGRGRDRDGGKPRNNRGDKPAEASANREGQRGRTERPERPERKKRPQQPRSERPAPSSDAVPDDASSDEQAMVDTTAPITDEQGNEAAAVLEEIIAKMGIEGKTSFVRPEDGSARINVSSEDSAILIGRKGRNLSAMQYLINRMLSRGDTNENTERVVVDVEGYVDRRRESLQEMALSMATMAKETQRNMRLKPLSPQERRIIHLALQDDEEIRTFSLGDSLFRSVVISPKNAVRPERPRSGRGSRGGRRRGGRGRSGGDQTPRSESQDIDVGAFGD